MIPNEKRNLNLPRNSTKNLPDVIKFVKLVKAIKIFLECDSERKRLGAKEIYMPCAEGRRDVREKLLELLELIDKFSQSRHKEDKIQDY